MAGRPTRCSAAGSPAGWSTISKRAVGRPMLLRKVFSRARCCATARASADGRTGTQRARNSRLAAGTFSNSVVTAAHSRASRASACASS